MIQARATDGHPMPDFDLAIDVAIPEQRWHDVEDDLEASVASAARATIGQAGANSGLEIRTAAEISSRHSSSLRG